MKKKILIMVMIMLLGAVLTAGCGKQEDIKQAESSGEQSMTAEEYTGTGQPENPQEDTPASGQETVGSVPAQTESRQEDTTAGDTTVGNTADNTPVQTEKADHALLPVYRTRHEYGGILSRLTAAYELPDMELDTQGLFDGTYSVSDNRFAVVDVDGDSREELIISYETASMAGTFEIVYDYNPDTMKLTSELMEFPDMTFYANGIVKVMGSHNHTLSVDFWPYTLYQYNSQTDKYDFLAAVSAWDRAYGEVSYEGTAFPEETDLDGDGIVYEIQKDPAGAAEVVRCDEADYNAWISQYMNGAQEVQIDFKPVALENYQNFTVDHLALLRSVAQEKVPASQADVGWIYIQKSSLQEAENYLSGHYGMQWKENKEFEEEHIGSREGKEVFQLVYMNSGILTYCGDRVDDVTVFGIYPGMDENTAVATLMSYGFYPQGNIANYMITGDGFGNAAVSYKVSGGTITEVSVSAYCSYAG